MERPPLIQWGWFQSHSGIMLPYKIDCDAFDDVTIEGFARIIRERFRFSMVWGIPSGGNRLAVTLAPHAEPEFPTLIVDDVLTTGHSMEEARRRFGVDNTIGIVIFSRTPYVPDWVWPIFQVEDWTQCRATGLG